MSGNELATEAEDRVARLLCDDAGEHGNPINQPKMYLGFGQPCDFHKEQAWRIMDTIPLRFIAEPESVGYPMTTEEFLHVAREFQRSWPVGTWEDVKSRLDRP